MTALAREPVPRQAQEVEIGAIAAGGAGVGRLPDGRTVFVHRTAPGERVRIEVTEVRRRWARARLLEVLDPAPERRSPPCPYYERCGGCTLEHLRYEAQLEVKGRIIADALERIGKIAVVPPAVEPSPREVRYRNRVTFTLVRVGGGRVLAGFHELERSGRILDVGRDCLLLEEPLAVAWDALRCGWGRGARLLPPGPKLRLTLRTVRDGAVLVVHGGKGAGASTQLVENVPGLLAVWREAPGAGPRLLAGIQHPLKEWQDEALAVSGTAFLQGNREAAAIMQSYALEQMGEVTGRRVVDAYCGLGILARQLARRGAAVMGIERDRDAVTLARVGAPVGARFLEGAVEDRLSEALPADVVLLNPPRTGVHERVTRLLAESRAARIVYVSCDPATLARDAARLTPAYELRALRAFDLFPQTAHVETVATFIARAA
ncbi:MAG: class I SAM-dependent RNA methyltransferase [Gemmatimonadetes bacterium]|nr:class I SAM-dependent RNA methyltransferase [Gemmatimonadota bacterium]